MSFQQEQVKAVRKKLLRADDDDNYGGGIDPSPAEIALGLASPKDASRAKIVSRANIVSSPKVRLVKRKRERKTAVSVKRTKRQDGAEEEEEGDIVISRRSRSKKAVAKAKAKAAAMAKEVYQGKRQPPKRNRPFLMNPKKLGLSKLGPFWYSRNKKSPYYLSFEAYEVLELFLSWYRDQVNLEKMHRIRSISSSKGGATKGKNGKNPSLRYFLKFHILHCQMAHVIGCNSVGDGEDISEDLVDFGNDYWAMKRRFGRVWFDEFNRGKYSLLFNAPDFALEDFGLVNPTFPELPPSDDRQEECSVDDGSYDRYMLNIGVCQLNYFHWLISSKKIDVLMSRQEELHPELNKFIKEHKEFKRDNHLTTRQKLCRKPRGSVIVDKQSTFVMRL